MPLNVTIELEKSKVISQDEKKNYKETRNPRVQHSNRREQRKWSTENTE